MRIAPKTGVTNSTIRMRKLYRSSPANLYCCCGERKAMRTREPSKGGKGIRLKMPKFTLYTRINHRTERTPMESDRSMTCVKKMSTAIAAKATAKLAPGPANATKTSPQRRLRKLLGFTITGLAQPKRATKSIKRPIGSRCAKGFSVSRPVSFGVKSPIATATRACAYS